MNISNFLDPIDPNRIRKFNVWVKCSTILLGTCIAVIVCIEFFQILNLIDSRLAYKQYNRSTVNYNQIVEQKNKLEKEEQELKNKIQTITGCADKCTLCIDHLKGICTTTNGVHFTSYIANENSSSIIINCPTMKQAQQYIANLVSQYKFANLSVASVQPDGKKGLTITLKTDS